MDQQPIATILVWPDLPGFGSPGYVLMAALQAQGIALKGYMEMRIDYIRSERLQTPSERPMHPDTFGPQARGQIFLLSNAVLESRVFRLRVRAFARLASTAGNGVVLRLDECDVPAGLAPIHLVDVKQEGYEAALEHTLTWLHLPVQKARSTRRGRPSTPPASPPTTAPVAPPVVISVFISHASKDNAVVSRLVEDLRAKGVNVWIDHEGLRPGTPDWDREIRQNIAKSTGVIYVGSEDAAASQFVRDELVIARDKGIPVYPIWVQGNNWSDCIPIGLGHIQYADGRGDKYTSAVQAVIASLSKASK